jgi:hypothetical protein
MQLTTRAPPVSSKNVLTAKIAGLGQDDFLNVEIGLLFAASTNTAPSTFWFICYILSSESLLAEVRAEISKILTRKTVNGTDTVELDSTGFRQHCPLLISIWEETLALWIPRHRCGWSPKTQY